MRINTNENRILVDVDKTLITPTQYHLKNGIEFNYYGTTVYHKKLYNNISLMKAQKARGYEVIVHSANGWKWAEEVIKVLKLEEYVDEVATKPLKYIDDLPADQWMTRIFIEE